MEQDRILPGAKDDTERYVVLRAINPWQHHTVRSPHVHTANTSDKIGSERQGAVKSTAGRLG